MPRIKGRPIIITHDLLEDLKTMRPVDFAAKYGCTASWASVLRSRHFPQLHKTIAIVNRAKVLADCGKMSDAAVGQKHGISASSVWNIRTAHGIPPFQPHYSHSRDDVPVVRSCIFGRQESRFSK